MYQLTGCERKRWRRSWRWSGCVHAVGILTAMAAWLLVPLPPAGEFATHSFIMSPAEVTSEPLELLASTTAEEKPWMLRDAERIQWPDLDESDPRWQQILAEPIEHARTTSSQPVDSDARWLVAHELQRNITASQQRSREENLDDLTTLGERLTAVSSEAGVDEVSGTLGRILGQAPRATAPVEKQPEGPFDYSSGQVHDVKKVTAADGTVKYVATMIDAAGRTTEVELDAATGEQAFRTMEIVKSNPLLERVYRGVVMGLIDKMLPK